MNKIVAYTVGLLLAVVLTVEAFSLVVAHTSGSPNSLPSATLIPIIVLLALLQLAVQLVFFLHLGRDKTSRWNAGLFGFTFFGILVIVLASIWIMNHLNYNMTPTEMNQYISNQGSF